MSDPHIIPVSSGLFEHKDRIGPAIWEFLWCIDSITDEEIDEAGERWGIVHGGAPIKHERIASEIGTSERTVKRNMAILKAEHYITSIRVPYGEIIKVRKNKKEVRKRSAKNGTSLPTDRPEMAHLSDREVPNMAYLPPSDVPDLASLSERSAKNGTSNKDFKDLKDLNLAAITTTGEAESISDPEEQFIQVLNAYCELHNKFDTQVNGIDRNLMHRMIAQGVPAPLITKVMRQVFETRTSKGKKIHSFSYYEDAINEAWTNEQAPTTPAPQQRRDVATGTTRQPIGQTGGPATPSADETREFLEKQRRLVQQKQEALRRRAEEQNHGT
ncbi:phage-like element PBSX protein XkdB [Cohnella xylanilytica]|uniref:hypothetical protein n=1 Tax=Cohnella xylanilytica TaxID=557555 RepID=UPI001B0D12ED|nr:hypothetical protein [Cohnella xylanilytica]GIO13563.1 phage-like element PBSX protein XkdB [Cohnella xylanilytica]